MLLALRTLARIGIKMPIIKEKTIKVSSVIENFSENGLLDGEPEITETCADGFFKISDDGYLLTYSEDTEGGRVITDIEIKDAYIYVKRRGATHSDMHFSEGFTDKSVYEVSPYKFDVEVYTKKIRKNLDRDGGRVNIFYTMNIGGAQKNVRMRIEVTCGS